MLSVIYHLTSKVNLIEENTKSKNGRGCPGLEREQRGCEFPVGSLDGEKPQNIEEAAGGDPNGLVSHARPVHQLPIARLQDREEDQLLIAKGVVGIGRKKQSSRLH